jgi:hypothetical protein
LARDDLVADDEAQLGDHSSLNLPPGFLSTTQLVAISQGEIQGTLYRENGFSRTKSSRFHADNLEQKGLTASPMS